MDLILLTVTDRKQTQPLIREGASHGQDSNRRTGTNIWLLSQKELDTKTDRLTDRQP
jgi:hypothetical protein